MADVRLSGVCLGGGAGSAGLSRPGACRSALRLRVACHLSKFSVDCMLLVLPRVVTWIDQDGEDQLDQLEYLIAVIVAVWIFKA